MGSLEGQFRDRGYDFVRELRDVTDIISQALELQPTYAPDVKIAGGAYGGALPNTTAIMGESSKITLPFPRDKVV